MKYFILGFLFFVQSTAFAATHAYKITNSIVAKTFDRDFFFVVSAEPPAVFIVGGCDDAHTLSMAVTDGTANLYDWDIARKYDLKVTSCNELYNSLKSVSAKAPITLYFNH
jgi:hypothetical protein